VALSRGRRTGLLFALSAANRYGEAEAAFNQACGSGPNLRQRIKVVQLLDLQGRKEQAQQHYR
jgi:hypothetical protein